MRYAHREEDTLSLTLVRSLDQDPPFDPARLIFRGSPVLFPIVSVEIRWKPGSAPATTAKIVTDMAAWGHKRSDPALHDQVKAMREAGIEVVGYGDPRGDA